MNIQQCIIKRIAIFPKNSYNINGDENERKRNKSRNRCNKNKRSN